MVNVKTDLLNGMFYSTFNQNCVKQMISLKEHIYHFPQMCKITCLIKMAQQKKLFLIIYC